MSGSVSSPDPPVSPVSLAAGPVTATICGGDLLSVSSLCRHGVERLADPAGLPEGYRVHGVRAGITLLHPWANRLSVDRFSFRGVTGRLDAGTDPTRISRDGAGLAIHGLGAPTPWRPVRDGVGSAVASLTWLGEPGFPYPHQITVRFRLTGTDGGSGALAISTTVCALGDEGVPVSFGWHPYFQRDLNALIELPALSFLQGDARGLPTGEQTPQAPRRIALLAASFDDGVSELASGAEMTLLNQSAAGSAGDADAVTVQFGAGYRFGQLFAPPDAPVVSFEPMTAPTDALVRGTDLAVAEPEVPWTADFVIWV
jgi:aldose 1-epimerase